MASAVICPACQARNRAQWDFCARCGESLEGTPVAITDVSRKVRRLRPVTWARLYLVLMVAVVAGTVALACRDLATHPAPPAASPGVFTFGGRPRRAFARARRPCRATPTPQKPGDVSCAGQGAERRSRCSRRPPPRTRATPSTSTCWAGPCGTPATARTRVRSYAEAARLDPERTACGYAQALETVGRPDEAATEFEAALVAQPASAIAQEGLSRIYYRRGEFAKALPLLEALAAQDARPRRHAAARLRRREDRGPRARDRHVPRRARRRAASRRRPGAPGREPVRCGAEGRGGRRCCRRASSARPRPRCCSAGSAAVLERTGRTAEAAAAYREYARLAPNAPEAEQIAARAARLEASVRSGS